MARKKPITIAEHVSQTRFIIYICRHTVTQRDNNKTSQETLYASHQPVFYSVCLQDDNKMVQPVQVNIQASAINK